MMDIQAQWKRLSELLLKKQFASSLSMGLSVDEKNINCAVYAPKDTNHFECVKLGNITYDQTKPLSTALIDLQNTYKLNNLKCCWTITPQYYQTLLIDKPKVMAKEYRAVALWQVKDLLEFPIQDCVVDVFLPSELIAAHKNKLYVVVSKRSHLISVVDLLNSINISVESIITREFAERNIISTLDAKDENIAFLSRFDNLYTLTIFRNNEILFSRRISKNIDYELMRSLEYFNIILNQAQITRLFTQNISTEGQANLKTALEQSNFNFLMDDISVLHPRVEIETAEKMKASVYAVGAALQFKMEKK